MAAKIDGMLSRRYLGIGPVKSCLHFFAVPKGPTDIRIVYDGTSWSERGPLGTKFLLAIV